jgi:hypothetical protein
MLVSRSNADVPQFIDAPTPIMRRRRVIIDGIVPVQPRRNTAIVEPRN